MRKIPKSEVNDLYKVINDHIDNDYIKSHKIDPRNLKKYFTKVKIDNFLNRIGLSDVENIRTVVKDVIEDREAAVKDKVIKFESFLNESINLPIAGLTHEKVLADCFRSSLSHVELKDKKTNHFIVDDLGEKHDVVIFSQEDKQKFKTQLLYKLTQEILNSSVEVFKLDVGLESKKNIKTKLQVELEGLIDEDKLADKLNEKITDQKLLDIISEWLNDYPVLKTGKKWSFWKNFKDHSIWKLETK
jgi:hypothetical protein